MCVCRFDRPCRYMYTINYITFVYMRALNESSHTFNLKVGDPGKDNKDEIPKWNLEKKVCTKRSLM